MFAFNFATELKTKKQTNYLTVVSSEQSSSIAADREAEVMRGSQRSQSLRSKMEHVSKLSPAERYHRYS